MRNHYLLALLLGLALPLTAHAQQPFERFGVKVRVVTLSNGKYPEFFGNDSLRRIGSVVYNTRLRRIAYLLPGDSLVGRVKSEVTSRFFVVDPLAEKYSYITPYAYTLNNPIRYMDPDGRQVIGADGKPVTYSKNEKTGVVEFSPNATAHTKTLISAMYETKDGTAAAQDMMTSKVKLTLAISDKVKSGFNKETGKQGVMYAETVGKQDENGDYESATVTVYKGTLDAEKSGKLGAGDGGYRNASEPEFYNGVMSHEKGHVDNDGKSMTQAENCKDCSTTQRAAIVEQVPNEREQHNRAQWKETHP